MSSFRTVAVVGATGSLGQHIVEAICAEGDRFHLTVITRKSSSSEQLVGVKTIKVDSYSDNDQFLLETLRGQDVLIVVHNTTAHSFS
jgi:putative NADH-flavin reductase